MGKILQNGTSYGKVITLEGLTTYHDGISNIIDNAIDNVDNQINTLRKQSRRNRWVGSIQKRKPKGY